MLLYRTIGPSVNLCGYIQLERLEQENAIEFRHRRILDVQKKDIEWAEVVIFVRGDGLLDELMAETCRKAGKYILFILDDDLLNVPKELKSGSYYAQKSVKRHICRIMKYADCLASPSERLLEKYGGMYRYSFRIIEPSAFQISEKKEWEDGKIHIGFAGAADRGSDVDSIALEALKTIMARYGSRICLELFGPETGTARQLGCKTYPYMETYKDYQRRMAELNWSIGLAPMPDSEFHSCKHYNKLVEYCGFGIVGVYSNVPPYAGAVEQRVTGLLCENTADGWADALTQLIEDDDLRRNMAANCLERARTMFSVETAAMELKRELDKLPTAANSGTSDIKVNLTWIKVKGLVSWYFEKCRKFGWKTPVVAVKKIASLAKKEK